MAALSKSSASPQRTRPVALRYTGGAPTHRADLAMTPPALVGTVLDGKFEIEKALASGPGGDVYEALHLGLGSRVAVKVLRPGIPETADIRRKRFMREARVAARIKSDHVVRVFDIVAPEQGLTYIVMELLDGETLLDRFRRVGPMPAEEAVGYILQAAKPLAELHDAGIVHRDVKPSNLFIARTDDGKERVKLLDFGVAAFQQPVARESALTLSEAIVGTPRYMAPEQVVASSRVDPRTDVWALGVTLYELLAGTPPFRGETVLAVLNQIERQEPKPLGSIAPSVPAGLATLVHRCLEKDPAKRPADARALAEALGAPQDVAAPPTVKAAQPVAVRSRAVSLTNVEGAAPVHSPTTLDAPTPSAPGSGRRRTIAVAAALAAIVVVAAAFASQRTGASAAPTAWAPDVSVSSAPAPTALPSASVVSDAPAPSTRPATATRPNDPPRPAVAPTRAKPPPRVKLPRSPNDDDRIE
jgi:serine/threonine protein kinase